MLKLCWPALSVAVSILGNSGAGKKGSSRAKPAAGQTPNRNAVSFTARLKHLQHVSEAQWTLLTTKRMPMMHSKVWSGVSDKTPDTRKGITRMSNQECHLRLERHGHRKEEAAAVIPGRQNHTCQNRRMDYARLSATMTDTCKRIVEQAESRGLQASGAMPRLPHHNVAGCFIMR